MRGFPGRIHSSRAVGETLSSGQDASGNDEHSNRSHIDANYESDMQVSAQIPDFKVPVSALVVLVSSISRVCFTCHQYFDVETSKRLF